MLIFPLLSALPSVSLLYSATVLLWYLNIICTSQIQSVRRLLSPLESWDGITYTGGDPGEAFFKTSCLSTTL